MPKLIKCADCGADISKLAKACPHCSAPNKPPASRTQIAYAAIGLSIFIALIVAQTTDDDGGQNTIIGPPVMAPKLSNAATNPQFESLEKKVASDEEFGCVNRDYFEKLVHYGVQKDEPAFKRGLSAGIITNKCTLLKQGETVLITDTALLSGLIKIRRKGNPVEFWTNFEAVK